jgi:YfiH family protein
MPAADIIVGRNTRRVFAVQAADCIPLLIADRRSGAVAAAHAGWRGLSQGVPAFTVRQMQRQLGSDPADLVAACGPSIGACCYEVGEEVRSAFVAARFENDTLERWFSSTAASLPSNPPVRGVDPRGREGHWFFDGWQCVRDQLIAAGLSQAGILVAGLCTASHPHLLCSYRRDGTFAGRIAGAICPHGA